MFTVTLGRVGVTIAAVEKQLVLNIIVCVYVCILALISRHANRILSALYFTLSSSVACLAQYS